LLSVTELPVHTATLAGVIAAGDVLTVTPFMMKQPVSEIVYVILAVPGATPVTNPPALTVAIVALLLLHVPPGVVLVNVAVLPTQRMVGGIGLIILGSGLTVTTAVVVQPVPNEYVTVAVPATKPVTTPVVALTVILAEASLHVPPAGVDANVVVEP
jgi:hypothetical protein